MALRTQTFRQKLRGRLVFVALRGKSKRSYVGIDDITVGRCGESAYEAPRQTYKKVEATPVRKIFDPEQQAKIISQPGEIMRILAARRKVHTRQFTATSDNALEPDTLTIPTISSGNAGNKRKRNRTNSRRRGKNHKKKGYEIVYFTEEPTESNQEEFVPTLVVQNEIETGTEEIFVPTLISQGRPEINCGFMEYTHGLKRCLRAFFSMLKQNRSPRKCETLYSTLERCVQGVANRCIPDDDMTGDQVDALVSDTMRNKLKTQQVYCHEEGAFVYPEFSLGSLPLQCNREYFMKLSTCGGSFAGIFNIKHGDPKLCREYFTANECQRRTTAAECNFDTRTMLIYGLNLQYQFAHNPFCLNLPFSAWWPHA